MVYASLFAKKVLLFLFPVSKITTDGESTRDVFTETVLSCLALVQDFALPYGIMSLPLSLAR